MATILKEVPFLFPSVARKRDYALPLTLFALIEWFDYLPLMAGQTISPLILLVPFN
jgi:hypothetical protein